LIIEVIGKMPINRDKGKPLTKRQKELVEGIKVGMNEGKTNLQIASELGISEAYVNDLKMRAGLTKKGSKVRDWIEENGEVRDWLREIRGGEAHESTKKVFAGALKKYCEFRGLTPAELLDEAEEDLKLERRKRKVKRHLLDFKDHLKETGRSKTTVGHYMSAINSFFTSHDVFLPKLSNGSREVEWEKEEFDRERVKELVNVCSPRERAMFLTMFQSGLAANEVSNLRIRDLKDAKDDITVLRLQRQKNGYRFITFMGRDARAAIEQYLKIRNEGALIPTRPNLSQGAKVKTEDDFLFITYDTHAKQWNKIDAGHVSIYMMQACKKLGWYKGEKRNPWRPHALRASFATILNNNGVPKNFVDFMLGHKQGQTDEAYFKSHFDTLFKYYKDSEHLLSISELEKVPDSKYEELMIELHKRNGEVKELREEIEAVKAREAEKEPYEDIVSKLISDPRVLKLVKEVLMEKTER
jgi:integrase/DNA-binding CsgD family transcriptional regulator